MGSIASTNPLCCGLPLGITSSLVGLAVFQEHDGQQEQRGNAVRTNPHAHPQHMKWVTHFTYVLH
jgi:hypothetical protein